MRLTRDDIRELGAPDMTLAVLGLSLLLVGLVAISSASIEYAEWHFQNAWYHSQRHFIYLVAALRADDVTPLARAAGIHWATPTDETPAADPPRAAGTTGPPEPQPHAPQATARRPADPRRRLLQALLAATGATPTETITPAPSVAPPLQAQRSNDAPGAARPQPASSQPAHSPSPVVATLPPAATGSKQCGSGLQDQDLARFHFHRGHT